MERGICPIAVLCVEFYVVSLTLRTVTLLVNKGAYFNFYHNVILTRFGSRDVIGHVIIITAVGGFLRVVHWRQTGISHGFRDIKRCRWLYKNRQSINQSRIF